MRSRCVKWSLFAAVLLLVLPVVAGASTARLMGMGVQNDFVKDYTNIFTYPSCLPNVGNVVFGELGQVTDYDTNFSEFFTTEDRSFGAVLGNLFDGRFGSLGFVMREYSPALGVNFQPQVGLNGYFDEYWFGTGFDTFLPNNSGVFSGLPGVIDPNVPGVTGDATFTNGYGTEALDLMWGKKFDKLSLGLRFNRSFYKLTNNSADFTEEGFDPTDRNITGLGGGIGFDISDRAMIEGALLWQSRTFKFDDPNGVVLATPGVFEDDGGGSYLASVRMTWQWKPDVMIVPVGRYYSFDLSSKFTPVGGTLTTTDVKLHGWQIGAAGNWALNQNDLFILGLDFAQNVLENKTVGSEQKFTESLMPTMFAALETHVNHWLTLRVGGRKGVFYNNKLEDETVAPTDVTKESWSPFQFFLGTGVKVGTLQLDATLAQDFFHSPANYLTGTPNQASDTYPLFPRVTATYSF